MSPSVRRSRVLLNGGRRHLRRKKHGARTDHGSRSMPICFLFSELRLAFEHYNSSGVGNWPGSSNSRVLRIEQVRRRDKP